MHSKYNELKLVDSTMSLWNNFMVSMWMEMIAICHRSLTSNREMWSSEVVAVGQNLRSISSQAGLQLLNVFVTLTLSHRSFNYDTDQGRVWITLGDWHCGLETFMLGSRFRTHAQSSNTACSTGQSVNHLHHRGDELHHRGDDGKPHVCANNVHTCGLWLNG